MRWKPGLTIRRNYVDGKAGVQVSDPIALRRYRLSKAVVLDAMMTLDDSDGDCHAKEALRANGLVGDDWSNLETFERGLRHWSNYNWTLAASYYLWARRDRFLDEGPDYETIRCDALREMLSESSVPLPILVDETEAIDLGEPAPIPSESSLGDLLRARVTTQRFRATESIRRDVFAGLLSNGFAVSRRYHIPDVEEHIHNLLHGVGFAFDPYIAVFNIEGLQPGLYYYSISQDRLRMEREGDFRRQVCAGLIGHQQALSAACTVFLVVDFPRFQWRYRHERALRNLYVDVGRMAQYLLIMATAYGVKNHITPATVDSLLARMLGIDDQRRQVFYSITLGY